jgi:protein TonB
MSRNLVIAAALSAAVHAGVILPVRWAVKQARVEAPSSSAAQMDLVHVDVVEGARRAGEGVPRVPAVTRVRPRAVEFAPVVDTAEQSAPGSPGAALIHRPPAPPSPDGEGPAPVAAPQAPTPDPGIESELHARLQSNATRCYPSASRRFHEQGTSEVSFCITDSGQLSSGTLVRSSGSERLDHAALDCVIGTSEPFPAARGRCFSLPVRFGE